MALLQQTQSHTCAACGHSGCDVRIKGCPQGCAYHARCIDLASIARNTLLVPAGTVSSSSITAHHAQGRAGDGETAELTTCPCCTSPATGLEIIPLSFAEIDQSRRLSGYRSSKPSGTGGKRMHVELMTSMEGGGGGEESTASFYDPSSPRTGKWSEEEIAFRDEMVPRFVEGSLPLIDGCKLIDFLSKMLKSKPSRLTKKMKHAKLSTRHFHLDSGFIRSPAQAKELSRLESAFVNSISDPVERSEIKFHMQREWRDHLAERLTSLRLSFDAEEWLRSVDAMDRRITLAKSKNRMVKRRFMMGKALEKDKSSPTPGIFIDESGFVDHDHDVTNNNNTDNHGGEDLLLDFDLLASALDANDNEDDDLRALYCSMAADQTGLATGTSRLNHVQSYATQVSSDGSGRSMNSSPAAEVRPSPFRSALFPSLGNSDGPNFRFAAPFLAKITAYIEHNRVPFEHIDIWVPSSSNPVMDPTGATAPEQSLLGSGGTQEGAGRLCFAGSASVGVQIMPDDEGDDDGEAPQGLPQPPLVSGRSHTNNKVVPLSSDEIYHLSLFGSYSEKFSFLSGCGLPGRVYESAVPAWEQFIAKAPSHLFERRGGAMQFGIKTALGLPIRSPNVGRIVIVLYSKHNREKDDQSVARMVRDFQSLNPCPRWKLMVDMGKDATPNSSNNGMVVNPASNAVAVPGQQQAGAARGGGTTSQMSGLARALGGEGGLSEKNLQISNLISLLGENMPSDQTSLLGQQLHNIMSLRLILLNQNRSPKDEHLVDSILTLLDSYLKAGRLRPDITLMLARDFAFHSSIQHQQVHHQAPQQQQQVQQQHVLSMPSILLSQQAPFQRQVSLPVMQQLSLGASASINEECSSQLDHMHHGQQAQASPSHMSQSFTLSENSNCSNQDLQPVTHSFNRSNSAHSTATTMDRVHSNASLSTLAERNYPNPEFQTSPGSVATSLTMRMESKNHRVQPPPESLHS